MNTQTLKYLDRLVKLILVVLPRRSKLDVHIEPNSILVIKLSAMGDALCVMPAVRMIKNAFPSATVDWLTTNRANPEIFRNLGFLNKTIILPITKFAAILFVLRSFWQFRRYDLIIDFDQYYQVSELLARCGKLSAGFDAPLKGRTFGIKVPYHPELNEKYQFRDLAEQVINHWCAGHPPYDPSCLEIIANYDPPKELLDALGSVKSKNLPLLVIYPGSSRSAKFRRWNWHNYLEVILHFQGICEVIVAGSSDEEDISQLLEKENLKAHNWIGRWTLLDWAWIFAIEKPCLLGNDGGLLHVAGAVNLPVIGIFGPSKFSKWGSVHSDSVSLEVELDCRPCLQNYLGKVPQECWKGTSECLSRISPTKVIEAINHMLGKVETRTYPR